MHIPTFIISDTVSQSVKPVSTKGLYSWRYINGIDGWIDRLARIVPSACDWSTWFASDCIHLCLSTRQNYSLIPLSHVSQY